jgi:hypothetical protein
MSTTVVDPKSTPSKGTFADHLAHPAASASDNVATALTYKLELYFKTEKVGYLGIDGGGWCVVTDEAKATKIESYIFEQKIYLRTTGGYLSVSNTAYVGQYNWIGARGWEFLSDGRLRSEYNGQHLSFHSRENGFLYAWDAYNVLTVKKV